MPNLAVNGTLMRGLELNSNLTDAGATFVRESLTSPHYRLWSIQDRHPAMMRDPENGTQIHLEIWDISPEGLRPVSSSRNSPACASAASPSPTEVTSWGFWVNPGSAKTAPKSQNGAAGASISPLYTERDPMSRNFTIPKHHRHPAFDPTIPPVLEVAPGDTVTFETDDAPFERLFSCESIESIGLETFNAVTGPVAVENAQPGDALRLELLDIALTCAWSVWLPGYGGFGHRTDQLEIQPISLEPDRVRISKRLTVPLSPMIGCIGLAPARGRSSSLAPTYPWGGNMDLRELSPGATLYLPVQVPGALLSLGDLHAAMGTGEPACVSLEAAGRATLRVGLEKGMALKFPLLRLEGQTLCIGMARTLPEAQAIALDSAYDLLLKVHGLTPFEAYAYACARVSLRFGGPASPTVLAVVPDP